MKKQPTAVKASSAQFKKVALLPVFNFTLEQEGAEKIGNWGWTPFSFLHFAVIGEHRKKGFGLNGDGNRLSDSICYKSFFPDTENTFSWIVETSDRAFENDSVILPRLFTRPIRECPFDLFKGRGKHFRPTSEQLYVPAGWAKEVWEYARWGVISIAAVLEKPDPYLGRTADGKGFPVTAEMLAKLGRRTVESK